MMVAPQMPETLVNTALMARVAVPVVEPARVPMSVPVPAVKTQLPNRIVLTEILKPFAVTVPLVPEVQLISICPPSVVEVGTEQPVQVNPSLETEPLTATPALPVFSKLIRYVPPVHVWRRFVLVSSSTIEPTALKSAFVPDLSVVAPL